jgi:hypothetical protein
LLHGSRYLRGRWSATVLVESIKRSVFVLQPGQNRSFGPTGPITRSSRQLAVVAQIVGIFDPACFQEINRRLFDQGGNGRLFAARFLISAASSGFTDAARLRVFARLGRRRGKGTGRRGSSCLFGRAIGLKHKRLMWCRNKRVDTLNGCNVVARQERTSRVALAVKARIDISLSVKGNKSRCRIATIGSMIRSWNAN